ncbi:unnamed protein product [Phytophthora lilii]|uniref:Unnamed protein product n=1 Tax=Phytophthora lilii TaxID=2077276 RepID=A0A9W7CPC7_9STRA|nr:unnamed protein product [Phytophthora lilii]
MPPLSRVVDRPLNFFQFHFICGFDDNDQPIRIIGWGHPELISLLKYSGTCIFIDGTFRCVPRGFQQCIVVMVHDRSSGLYVPVFYVLTTHRTMNIYRHVLHFIIQAADEQLEPAEFICDFERALINAVQIQFPAADIIGCLFHFKQAVRRRMKTLGISKRATSIAMESGVLDMLTVITPDLISSRAREIIQLPDPVDLPSEAEDSTDDEDDEVDGASSSSDGALSSNSSEAESGEPEEIRVIV